MNNKEFLTENLLKKSISLISLGIHEIAWKRAEVLEVIEEINKKRKPILGGDIYKKDNGLMCPTYDNWYCELNPNENIEDFVIRSIDYSKKYIESYKECKGIEYYYTIIT